jgi:hypothetical protein
MASRWPIEDAGLADISLDLRNVRIPRDDIDESAIASYLVEAEDLLGLARDILRDGYLDNEIPVVTYEDGRLVVLEGNRRITALKAIHDPSLIGRYEPSLERLLSRYPDAGTPTEIRVMVAPSREAAEPLLARLHTGRPKRPWIREQQAVFYHAQLSATTSVDDLRTLYPREGSKIASFIRMGEMREVIRRLRYSDRELEEFVKNSQLKMTAFEYAYEPPKVQQVLGLNFDRDGLLASKRMTTEQRRGLMYLLGRFRDKTLNTRSPELRVKSSQHDQFVEQLRRVVTGESGASGNPQAGADTDGPRNGESSGQPSGATGTTSGDGGPRGNESGATGGGGSGATGNTGDNSGESGNGGQAGSRGRNRGDTKSRLDMDGFEYQGSSAGLRRRFEELKRLDLRDFPNATHDLLRTVLECSIKDYFISIGRPLAAGRMLSACVDELAREFQNDQRMTTLINFINRRGRMPAQQFAGTQLSLNASNHEPDSFVIGSDVHEAWEHIKPILVEIVGK